MEINTVKFNLLTVDGESVNGTVREVYHRSRTQIKGSACKVIGTIAMKNKQKSVDSSLFYVQNPISGLLVEDVDFRKLEIVFVQFIKTEDHKDTPFVMELIILYL